MIGLVHLVWAPLGPEPLRRFLRSYVEFEPGVDHELVVLLNGVGQVHASMASAIRTELDKVDHRPLEIERPSLDLDAYGQAAELLEHEQLCFVNSYGVVQAPGWLQKMARALAETDVGLVATTGSWESQAEWVRGRLRHRPQQLMGLARARRDFPRFPNPHIRTSVFMIERQRLLDVSLTAVDKRAAYLLESGHQSITRRVQAEGLRAVVVGRDGVAYDPDRWPESRTFRSDDQQNLLVADNRTLDYQTASARHRRRLSRDSWGAASPVTAKPVES